MRRILVTGAAGFIGRNVLDHLVAQGRTVVGYDLRRPEEIDPGVDWVQASLSDEGALASAASRCDVVLFLAGGSLPANANDDMSREIDMHVRCSVRVAEVCARAGVGRFVFASSGGTVYGRDSEAPIPENAPTQPLNAYGVSKLAVEHYLRVLNHLGRLRTLSLRISNPYGPGQAPGPQGFIAAALHAAATQAPLRLWGDGSVVRDFLFVGDLAAAFAAAADYEGSLTTLNIGAGRGASLSEVIAAIETALGRPLAVEYLDGRKIDVARNVLDIRAAREELRWEPRVSLETGLRATIGSWPSLA